MFDEVVTRVHLGCKIARGHVVAGRLNQDDRRAAESVVFVSQTLDKLVVHEPSPSCGPAGANGDVVDGLELDNSNTTDKSGSIELLRSNSNAASGIISPTVYYIAVKDVIRSIGVKSIAPIWQQQQQQQNGRSNLLEESQLNAAAAGDLMLDTLANTDTNDATATAMRHQHNATQAKDLLLIGCSSSLLIYDALNRNNRSIKINTPSAISAIATTESTQDLDPATGQICVCGGPQKLMVIKFESSLDGRNWVDAELSSERSTGDTITCLAMGHLAGWDLVLSGSAEHKIRAYQLDSFDQNIQACRLTIGESSQINCLCPIYTTTMSSHQQQRATAASRNPAGSQHSSSSALPSVGARGAPAADLDGWPSSSSSPLPPTTSELLQMNYFAYGLDAGFVGVYRLFQLASGRSSVPIDELEPVGAAGNVSLASERVWRQGCKSAPLFMKMYDLNGDGLDELVVGYENGRVEARSPFTGQLLAATRCFRPALQQEQRLAGLAVADYQHDGRPLLLACSTSGSMVGFRPKLARPRQALRGFAGLSSSSLAMSAPPIGDEWLLYHQQASDELPISSSSDWLMGSGGGGGAAAQTGAGMKTIEEEKRQHQQHDVFMGEQQQQSAGADLHIETQTDDAKPVRCDAKQSGDLLQRINALQTEQMELERRACHIYQMNADQASRFYPSDVSVAHRWDFDSAALYLRLTIVISTSVELVKLVKLEDESRNFLASGYLLVNLDNDNDSANNDATDHQHQHHHRDRTTSSRTGQQQQQQPESRRRPAASPKSSDGSRSHVVVVPLRSVRDEATRLSLWVFCESLLPVATSGGVSAGSEPTSASSSSSSKTRKLCRVYSKPIEVPKFAMFTFAPLMLPPSPTAEAKLEPTSSRGEPAGGASSSSTSIGLSFQLRDSSKVIQVLDWLNENFLCFQFERLIRSGSTTATTTAASSRRPTDAAEGASSAGAPSGSEASSLWYRHQEQQQQRQRQHPGLAVDDSNNFQLSLIDVRHTLQKVQQASESKDDAGALADGAGDESEQMEATSRRREGKPESTPSESVGRPAAIGKLPTTTHNGAAACKFAKLASTLRIGHSYGTLTLECESSDLVVDLVQSLLIDRLHLPSLMLAELAELDGGGGDGANGEPMFVADVRPILDELETVSKASREMEESEKRIQTELYESADYTRNLIQQFAIANELNEFTIAKDLLTELFMMLNGAQNAARAHCLNSRSRARLSRQVSKLIEKITFLSGQFG